MADEITYSVRLSAVKGDINIKREHCNGLVTMTGDAYSARVQSIPTTAGGTALSIAAAVGTPGLAIVINQDATNYVDLGVENGGTFYPAIKLKPGEGNFIRFGSELAHARADTGAVLLEMFILED